VLGQPASCLRYDGKVHHARSYTIEYMLMLQLKICIAFETTCSLPEATSEFRSAYC